MHKIANPQLFPEHGMHSVEKVLASTLAAAGALACAFVGVKAVSHEVEQVRTHIVGDVHVFGEPSMEDDR